MSEPIISNNELTGRQMEAALDNFYSGFTNGPYVVQEFDRKRYHPNRPLPLNTTAWTHAIFDGKGKPVISGTLEDCERFAERFNLAYAKHIMTKDIKPMDKEIGDERQGS